MMASLDCKVACRTCGLSVTISSCASGSTRHCMAVLSMLPTLMTQRLFGEKRTSITCEQCAMYSLQGSPAPGKGVPPGHDYAHS